MTVLKSQLKKSKNTPPTLQLSGSQINLSTRPMFATRNVTWSCSYRSYPIRRSVSAFGFQQSTTEESEHARINSRPLSADNIPYVNREHGNSTLNYRNRSETTISSYKRADFSEICPLSENMYENILNGYSENKRFERYSENTQQSNLTPGLSSKPPLPPFTETKPSTNCTANTIEIEIKADSANEAEAQTHIHVEKALERTENLKTAAEKEAFDEIIALKFQRWFPNTSNAPIDGSSSDGETDDVELLSYKERNYKTCEYRYEILRKNAAKKVHVDSSDGVTEKKLSAVASKWNKNKNANKLSSKNKILPPSTRNSNGNANREITASRTDYASSPPQRQSFQAQQRQKDSKNTHDKFANVDKNDATEVFSNHKISKTSSFKTSNSQSPFASPSKKQKKISFSIDKKSNDGEDEDDVNDGNSAHQCEPPHNETSEDFVETYFANKNYNLREHINRDDRRSNEDKSNMRDTIISPQQPAGSQIEDVLSWMGAHHTTNTVVEKKLPGPQTEINNSMYEEMIDILKDIEKEDIKDEQKLNKETTTNINDTTSSPAKAIWSLIEEAEKTSNMIGNENHGKNTTDHMRLQDIATSSSGGHGCGLATNTTQKNWNRLSDLLRLPSTELAQKVMALQLLLDERETVLQNLNARLKSSEHSREIQTQELQNTFQKQHKLIEQLKNEKRSIGEKMRNAINELESKHAAVLMNLEEKHKIELKKNLEKQAAADKLEREKWLEAKSHKIRELAIKGLEPELNRMAAAHQEEIAEIRRFHKRQIEDIEEAANRRMAVQKEKLEADKEKALAIEREISRQKLIDEIGELEKRYQEQRKRLLAEVHVERENMERENEATLAIREKDNERKWEKKSIEMQKKIEALQHQHQEEIKKLHQSLDSEKVVWMKNQMIELSDKENKIREQCKKERDKHIELIIQKLESENTERETNTEQKIKRLKEKYETEIHDQEMANENLKKKLSESRNEIQKNEETLSQLRAQLNQSQTEHVILKEKYERLVTEQGEIRNMAKSELTTRIHILQSELSQAQMMYESQMKSLRSENERELSQMYNKVKEMIDKKDYLIKTLNKQKDAALKQCNQLEELLELKRKEQITA